MKKLESLILIVMFTLPLAAQDTAPDQTAPDHTSTVAQPQPKTRWKDRLSKLAASSTLLPTQNDTVNCNASALFSVGECSVMVNGNHDNLAWERNAEGMQMVHYNTAAKGGAGTGSDMDYLGQVKGQETYYMRSADGNDTYKVEGTLKSASVTKVNGDAPTGLIGGSEEAFASQDDNSGGNLDDILKPIGSPVIGYKASAILPDKGYWQQVTIDQVDNGHIVRFHDKDNNAYKVVGSKILADGTYSPSR